DAFGVELPLRVLFEAPVLSDLAARVDAARQGASPAPPIVRSAGELPPLSFAQERLWFLDRLEPGSAAYNLATALRLSGDLDVPALAASLAEIARRHAALRTTFAEVAGEPRQIIAPPSDLPLPLVDLAALPGAEREAEATRLVHEDAVRPFDLARGPLVRALLLRFESREHGLILDTHHIVSDGWSQGVLVRESASLYEAFLHRRPSPLPELGIQYADFAVWQRRWLTGEVLEAQLAYWRETLESAPALLELPLDRPRPPVQTFRGAVEPVALTEELTAALRELGRREGVTLFMTLLAGFQALLHRLSGQDDVLVGSPVANRNRSETEGLIGFFVNTLVLRARFGSSQPEGLDVRTLLATARAAALEAYAHQDLPFERLVEELRIERSLAHGPLFQVMLALQNAPVGRLELPGLLLAPMGTGGGTAKFYLTLSLGESEGPLAGSLEYNTDLFDGSTVRRLGEQLEVLLAAAVADPDRRVRELPLLTTAQRSQLLVEWNDTARVRPLSPLVHERVAAWAELRPNAEAVVSRSRKLTYGELAARANRLAWHLRSLGVGPEVRVAVCMGWTVERVVAALAVLQAGGAYVTLDPTYPPERLAYLIADSRAPVVITEARYRDHLTETGATVLSLDADWESITGREDVPPESGAGPENLAYVVYTSGSTGEPKGVEVPHAGLLNLVLWHQERYAVHPDDRAGQVASPAFDASVWDLWPYLAAGAASYIPDEETRLSPTAMVRWWMEEGITLTFLPTPLAEAVLDEAVPPESELALRALLVGGDRLHHAPGPEWPFRLVNHYGPAECSVVSTALDIPAEPWGHRGGVPPIGRGIDTARLYVLDTEGELVPPGVPGELYIGGAGLARGYLGRPELTAAAFLPNPFAGEAGSRMYRTGDRVRWRTGGVLDFLGRFDHQVKVRGIRIELGEIEAVLARHPAVREAAVVLLRGGRQGEVRLVACVTPAEEGRTSTDELRAFLRERLPEAMVPAAFLFVDALPLTPNGKVDRRALEALAPGAEAGTESLSAAPRTPTEEIIAGIWADLLGRERVSTGDDFFALGGHSLLATRVVSRVRDAFGVELPLRRLFDAPTVEALAAAIDAAVGAVRGEAGGLPVPPLTAGLRGDRPRLSFAQERLWFLDQLDPSAASYSVSLALRLHGGLDPEVFARILTEVVRRHEVLRTTFAHAGGQPYQVIGPPAAVPVPVVDLRGMSGAERDEEVALRARAEAARPFDLANGPLLRALLLRTGEEDWVA
ncbi:MAG TPA: amino acid adenylation domain-containing protein, partial [Thermoanaerobaculia bacterium]|nr:amino acid adenylation domain-containing protein [Thermoanaerobaculia bacterium]